MLPNQVELAPGVGPGVDSSHRDRLVLRLKGKQSCRFARPTVLVVDDDLGTRETVDCALKSAGFNVKTASSGAEGIAAARLDPFDLILIDLRLPDMLGTDVVRVLRNEVELVPFVLVSGFLTIAVTVEAMKLGAVDVIEKPLVVDDLLAIVRSAVGDPQAREVSDRSGQAAPKQAAGAAVAEVPPALVRPRSAAERWAMYVLKACQSEGDFKTLEDWAAFVGVSYSGLCETCRLVGIRPHDARDLTRVLRAVIRSRLHHCHPGVLLDVSDRRTLKNILERGALGSGSEAGSMSIDRFVDRQQFVASDNEGLKVLRKFLIARFEL